MILVSRMQYWTLIDMICKSPSDAVVSGMGRATPIRSKRMRNSWLRGTWGRFAAPESMVIRLRSNHDSVLISSPKFHDKYGLFLKKTNDMCTTDHYSDIEGLC